MDSGEDIVSMLPGGELLVNLEFSGIRFLEFHLLRSYIREVPYLSES